MVRGPALAITRHRKFARYLAGSLAQFSINLGRVEFDHERRKAIYHQVHRLIHEDQPYTFVNSVPDKRPISKRIGNVTLSPRGPFLFFPGANYWFIRTDVAEAR